MPDRRTFLVASSCGIAGLKFGACNPLRADQGSTPPNVVAAPSTRTTTGQGGQAKSVILFFLCGGASHVDTWDMKPQAPVDYRGPFNPINTTAPDIQLCEHLPLLAKQSHHLAVIRSVCGSVNTNDHHAGYYYNLTGHRADPTFLSLGNDRQPYSDDWPYMGCVVASRRPSHAQLPNALTLPHKPSKAPYTRPGQFAARLGVEFDPLYVNGSPTNPLKFQAPALVLAGDVTTEQLRSRQQLLSKLDAARRDFDPSKLDHSELDHSSFTHTEAGKLWKSHQARTLDLLMSAKATEAFDVASEPQTVRDRYGSGINAMSLLLARRLAEAEVPFITVFWKEDETLAKKCASEGAWDTHGNNFTCLRENLLPEFDRGLSALIEDLAARNLLDQTLVLVTSEMGRKPKIGDPRSGGAGGAGRDHWTHCQSILMAGGGVRGGQVFGSSDRLAEYPADQPLTPADIAKTVYHATGINDLKATDSQGRVYNLLEEGNALTQLF